MELDELKIQLKQKLDESRGQKSPADIAILLTRKTQSILHKLKKSLWFEIAFCILAIIGFAYIGITSKHHSFNIYFSVFGFLFLAFLILLFYLLKKITQLANANMPVKENLVSIHATLKEFTKRYFQFSMSLIPICIFFSGYLGYQDGKNGDSFEEFDKLNSLFSNTKQIIVFIFVYMLVLAIGIYYFTKWYLKKLYGKYLDELQACIHELN